MDTPSSSQALTTFVDRLLEEKGLSSMDPMILAELRSDLQGRVEKHVNVALLAALPPQELPEFDRILASGDTAATQEFLQTKIPDAANVVAAALLRFRDTYLSA